jgi:hypothetical protein
MSDSDSSEPGQGKGANLVGIGGSPEKGFVMLGTGRNAASRDEAVGETRALSDRDAVPQGRAADGGADADLGMADDAVADIESARPLSGEDTELWVEIPASDREGPSPRERFERRAEEIARTAEIRERSLVHEEADRLLTGIEQRLPQVSNERGLARRNPPEQTRREDANARVQQSAWSVDAEGRDAIPFGLKRRVVLRIPILRDEQCRGEARLPVPGQQPGKVGSDRGVGIDHQKVAGAEERRGVSQSAGRAEDLGLGEKRELRKVRRLLAQVALDLIAEMMKINCYFANAGLVKPPELRHGKRHVEERQQGLRDRLGDGPESRAAARAQKDRSHGS